MDTANPTNYMEVPTPTEGNNESFNFTPSGKHRGICPIGWHVPTNTEWSTMEGVVNGSAVDANGDRGTHAGKLSTGCDWRTTEVVNAPGDFGNADRNSSGFSVVPSGYFNDSFKRADEYAYFWSSSEFQGSNQGSIVWNRHLEYNKTGVNKSSGGDKCFGFSVRCLRD